MRAFLPPSSGDAENRLLGHGLRKRRAGLDENGRQERGERGDAREHVERDREPVREGCDAARRRPGMGRDVVARDVAAIVVTAATPIAPPTC